ncbi:MAG: HlyD family efflux transporter periplasmic adaptor subunit [Candidatus Eisenbacteria bacterium]|uniref:HlyD family efflux transporter periplasmic adaptor subunit n=1 Tax=Eiseniibacteriota bacterium TaxID=2212470 RepID=A0A849SBR8_UNCEI|nr:HlyD family efflux transporter periplasmic adaptor subunit [Candidatus Eisenbacteria bacterium]
MDRPIPARELLLQARRRLLGWILGAGALIALVVILPGWVTPSIPRAQLRTAKVERGAIDATLTASGLVLPEHEFVVTSPNASRVLQTLHQPGDTVAAGEPILSLDQGEARLLVERLERQAALKDNERAQARIDLENRLSELTGQAAIKQLELESLSFEAERNTKLVESGVISGDQARKGATDLQRCRIEVEQLGAATRNAKRGLEVRLRSLALEHDILVRERRDAERELKQGSAASVRGGVLTWVLSGEGVSVARGDELARVADLSTFKVEATLSDVHAGRIRAGQPVVVRAGELSLPGTLTKVHPKVENGIVRIEVALERPDHPLLRPNLRVDVYIISERREGTLSVRRGSVISAEGGHALFRIHSKVADRRDVTLGITNFERTEILKGLEEGDEVILSDMSDYANRKEIRIR